MLDTGVIVCPRCEKTRSLTQAGDPILPLPPGYELAVVGTKIRYPVHCTKEGCDWIGSLTEDELHHVNLLEALTEEEYPVLADLWDNEYDNTYGDC